jgi:asparagine synthetase B (glutamine-hydrolysing)
MLFHEDERPHLFRDDVLDLIESHSPLQPATTSSVGAGFSRPGSDWLSDIQYRDLNHYLPLDILTKVDRMTMAHSLEARPPLLDHRLVEFAATIPSRFRLRDGTTKYLFKQAMRGVLPDAIIDRQKHGFAVPLAHWFRGELAGFARDVLLSKTCRERGIFEPRYLARLLQLNDRGRNLDLQLWTILSFELWCRRFLDAAPTQTAQLPTPNFTTPKALDVGVLGVGSSSPA